MVTYWGRGAGEASDRIPCEGTNSNHQSVPCSPLPGILGTVPGRGGLRSDVEALNPTRHAIARWESFPDSFLTCSLFPESSAHPPSRPASGRLGPASDLASTCHLMSACRPQLHQGPCWFPDQGDNPILASQPLTPHPGVACVVGTCPALSGKDSDSL